MKIGIMQPYFFPYIGYFQLLQYVDKMVIYDEIKYTKQSWINRNRILLNHQVHFFSIGLEKASDYLYISQRKISDQFLKKDRKKILAQIQNAYQKAPFFNSVFELIQDCFHCVYDNLFEYIFYSIQKICQYLEIKTPLIISSTLGFDNEIKKEKKVIAIVKKVNGTKYINLIGGKDLYDSQDFLKEDISLYFLKTHPLIYPQFGQAFQGFLSIIDVLMFNSLERTQHFLNQFSLVCKHPNT